MSAMYVHSRYQPSDFLTDQYIVRALHDLQLMYGPETYDVVDVSAEGVVGFENEGESLPKEVREECLAKAACYFEESHLPFTVQECSSQHDVSRVSVEVEDSTKDGDELDWVSIVLEVRNYPVPLVSVEDREGIRFSGALNEFDPVNASIRLTFRAVAELSREYELSFAEVVTYLTTQEGVGDAFGRHDVSGWASATGQDRERVVRQVEWVKEEVPEGNHLYPFTVGREMSYPTPDVQDAVWSSEHSE